MNSYTCILTREEQHLGIHGPRGSIQYHRDEKEMQFQLAPLSQKHFCVYIFQNFFTSKKSYFEICHLNKHFSETKIFLKVPKMGKYLHFFHIILQLFHHFFEEWHFFDERPFVEPMKFSRCKAKICLFISTFFEVDEMTKNGPINKFLKLHSTATT